MVKLLFPFLVLTPSRQNYLVRQSVIMRKFGALVEPFWDLKIGKYVEYLTPVFSEYIKS